MGYDANSLRREHPVLSFLGNLDVALAKAVIAGRIGGDPANLALTYRMEIAALERYWLPAASLRLTPANGFNSLRFPPR